MSHADKMKSIFAFSIGKNCFLGSNNILKYQFTVLTYHSHERTTLVY